MRTGGCFARVTGRRPRIRRLLLKGGTCLNRRSPRRTSQLSLTLAVHQRVMARAEATGLTPETVLVTLMDVVDEPAFRRAVAARLVAGLDRPAAAPSSQPGRAK